MSIHPFFGPRVRRLRLGLGLSQTELAERTNVAAGVISMAETSRLDVDDSTIEALADVLDCSYDYLVNSRIELEAGTPQLRAYADASQKTVDRTISDSITAIDAARVLELPLIPDRVPLFDGDLNDDGSVQRFAADVRSVAGLNSEEVIGNVIRTAERLGCVVLPMDSELGRHLGLSLRIDDVPVIRVSRSSMNPQDSIPGDRQRFTVAHELGHLALHHGASQPTSPIEAAKVEKEAHLFAAAFLIPGDSILKDLERAGGRVTLTTMVKLKEKWGFSVKAFIVRFRQLGVIDDDQARSLYKQISARRWNKVEPVEVGNESAIWLEKALKKAYPSEQASTISNLSGLHGSYFQRWTSWQPAESNVKPMTPVVRLQPTSNSSARIGQTTSRRVASLPLRRPLESD
jgi:Zn-dependent peptidase ImmA (M78 family)/transcriptional regulator with XRE-family HTH domain